MLAVTVNPTLPDSLTIWNVLPVVMVGVLFLLPVAALFSIWHWREHMETTHVLIWAAIVIFAPMLGSLVWFIAGKRLHPQPLTTSPSRALR